MTTTQIKRPLPRLFSLDSGRAALNSDKLFHEVAAGVPGYDELTATSDRIEALQLPTFRDEHLEVSLARAVLDGSSTMEEAARGLERELAELKFREGAGRLQSIAADELSVRAVNWLVEHEDELVAGYEKRLQELYGTARDVVSRLGSVHKPDDLVAHPEAAVDYSKLIKLSQEFNRIVSSVRNFNGSTDPSSMSQDEPTRWLFADLIRNYEDVWPEFYLSRPLVIWDGGGNPGLGQIDAVPAPWDTTSPDRFLRWLIDHDAEVWAPSSRRLRAKQRQLTENAEAARLERNDAELKAAGRMYTP
ncbi:hypothetical protein GCM10010988_05770 [Cnuibacter physcomitrellae]|uniref:Uncharacterized protein n=1 Tax=Cnuibacter physcomitrellae TaxID=1619308 RepID=A0A1X9LMI1_9MICO|nr:hypothetical protein [Cnuibacter physcomitrellae]ARJ05488.1 hypothetical protein B5808_09820 [Cnuibacter physcomitrellae]GGI35801.1 hypothetical protein GCM10010988_05770 [Cnuibacter physcomitrellae]